MKRLIYILLFIPLFVFGQSVEHNKLVFRETFDDEFSVRRNSGIPTDVTFSNGVATFDGISTAIVYNKSLNGTYSIRLRFKSFAPTNSDYILSLTENGGTGYLYLNTGTTIESADGTFYVNAINTTTVSSNTKEIIVSGITINCTSIHVGEYYTGSNHGTFELDLFEVYNYTLSAEEVENLYQNRRFHELTGQTEIISVSSQSGSIIDRWGNSLTLTDVDVVKDGDTRVMLFDGATSKIDVGSPKVMTGDRSLVVWAKPYSIGETAGRIIDDSKFQLYVTSTFVWRLRSNASGSVNTAPTSVELNKWQMISLSRAANGDANIYLNGVLSSSVNDNSGTPVAGANIIIGNDAAQTRSFDGLLSGVRIYEGILSANEISQIYTNEKWMYQK